MCTLTVFKKDDRVIITMNRDEKKARPLEIKPYFWKDEKILSPQDTLAKGTWIAVRRDGVWACLLNGYMDDGPRTGVKDIKYSSRGNIIPSILAQDNPLDGPDMSGLNNYRSFRLWVGGFDQIKEFFWDCTQMNMATIMADPWGFVTSSSWRQDAVKAYRQNVFDDFILQGGKFQGNHIPALHLYSRPGFEAMGINVQRDLTQTKSITQIEIDKFSPMKMRYWPCDHFDKEPEVTFFPNLDI